MSSNPNESLKMFLFHFPENTEHLSWHFSTASDLPWSLSLCHWVWPGARLCGGQAFTESVEEKWLELNHTSSSIQKGLAVAETNL